MPGSPTTLQAALRYAERLGWPVLPLHQKVPALSGPGGHLNASTDPAVIEDMWRRAGSRADGVGVNLEGAGLILLDIDPRNGGDLELLRAEFGPMPDTPEAHTGGGGVHMFFRRPDGCPATSKAAALGPGIDVKANGYAVLSPSLHPSGKRYSWNIAPSVDIADAPEWIIEALSPKPQVGSGTSPRAVVQWAGGVIPKGMRNSTLTSIAGSMRRRGLSETAIRAALHEQARDSGIDLPAREIDAIAASVARYAPDLQLIEQLDAIAEFCSAGTYGLNDPGNADRLAALYGHQLKWCADRNCWLVYNGRRWVEDRRELALALAIKAIRSIAAEGAACSDRDVAKETLSWAARSLSRARIEATLKLAKPAVAIESHELDSNPWVLNCRNGTLDLRTGELRVHDPGNLITKMCPVDYQESATDTLWSTFLHTATDGDAELIAYLQRMAGTALVGEARDDAWFFVHGPGGTGKTTFLRALHAVLGDYVATVDSEAILAQRHSGGGPQPEIAKLEGKRLAIVEELPPGRKLAEALVKNLTGGSSISVRNMYEKPREWAPQTTLIVAANDRPNVRAGDSGMWRRIREVPFTHVIPAEQRDPSLKDSQTGLGVRAGSAVLAWAVVGCIAWQATGIGTSARVEAATTEYRNAMNPLMEWMSIRIVEESDVWCATGTLYEDYKKYCNETECQIVPLERFGELLGAEYKRAQRRTASGKRAWGYAGITLLHADGFEGMP